MIKITTLQRNVLSLLSRHFDGLDVATLSIRYRLSPAQIHQAFFLLQEAELADIVGTKIRLTQGGRMWAQENREFLELHTKPWREVPERFLQRKLDINEPYAPRRSLMVKRKRTR